MADTAFSPEAPVLQGASDTSLTESFHKTMPDTTAIDSAISETADLPPEPVANAAQDEREESRREPRVHVRWHVDVLIDGQVAHHGFIKDISLKGADIFISKNLQNMQLVKLHIHVPPLQVTSDRQVLDVYGKIVYTAHDSNEFLFRTGIKFVQFRVESDRAYLRSRLSKR